MRVRKLPNLSSINQGKHVLLDDGFAAAQQNSPQRYVMTDGPQSNPHESSVAIEIYHDLQLLSTTGSGVALKRGL